MSTVDPDTRVVIVPFSLAAGAETGVAEHNIKILKLYILLYAQHTRNSAGTTSTNVVQKIVVGETCGRESETNVCTAQL